MLLFVDSISAMQKDTSSSDVSASNVGRVRHRRRPNEVSYVLIIFFLFEFLSLRVWLTFRVHQLDKLFIFSVCVAFTPCAGLYFQENR
jgi:hypothetical protein